MTSTAEATSVLASRPGDPAASQVSLWSDDGRRLPLDPLRWHAEPSPFEERLMVTLDGPVLDVGCGPARMVAALERRGVAALGIDPAPGAVVLARGRGAKVLRRSVFDPLPDEGRWRSLLLLDGNIGIGGSPLRLLRRCRELAASGGTVLAEVHAPGEHTRRGHARLVGGVGIGSWFPWAVVGADAVEPLAAAAGLEVMCLHHDARERRWIVSLVAGPASS